MNGEDERKMGKNRKMIIKEEERKNEKNRK